MGRTVRRAVRREVLWNGNREPLSNLWAWDPERNIIRWAWTRHDVCRDRYRRAARDPAHEHLEFVVLRSPADIDRASSSPPPDGRTAGRAAGPGARRRCAP